MRSKISSMAPLLKEGAEMKKYRLYERELGCMVEYDEETYETLRKMRETTCRKMRKKRLCVCSQKQQWRCNGFCDTCPYKKATDDSLNKKVGNSENLTEEDRLSDGCDYEEMSVGAILSSGILKRLDEIMPQAREIGALRLQGYSNREIAEMLRIPRTTMIRLLKKAKEILESEFGEF